MGKVIAKRFIFMIPVVLAVTFIIFMLSFISAGDAARALAEKKYEHPSPEQVEEVRHEEDWISRCWYNTGNGWIRHFMAILENHILPENRLLRN